MPIEKISELLKKITIEPDRRVDNLLLKIEKVKDSPTETAEVITMLFSIVDTNNKKNQQIMLEITSILLLVANKNHNIPKESSQKSNTIHKTGLIDFLSSLPPIAKIVLITGFSLSAFLVLFFFFYKIDPKATNSALKNTAKVETNLETTLKGKK